VSGYSAFGYFGYLFSIHRINDPNAVVAFISYQEQAIRSGPGNGLGRGNESEW
jgi:hypothetical protein